MARPSVIVAALALTASACSQRPSVEVRILPKSYEIGAVKSELATPAVDEVVRLNAGHVVIQTCTSTPPMRVIQFQEELRARSKAEAQLMFIQEGCG